MKIFIFGSNGMLGTYMKTFLSQHYTIICLERKHFDIHSVNETILTDLLEEYNFQSKDVVINCAGVIPQSYNQNGFNQRFVYIVNSIFPILLGKICEKMGGHLFHITTDCVFSGKVGKYNENSEADETNDYGISKSLGEFSKATIIRTSIIGEEIQNKRSLVEWVKSNKNGSVKGFANHFWNGVTCLQLSKMVHEIIQTQNFWSGVRHVFSPTTVSKYDILVMINEIYNLNISIQKHLTDTTVDKSLTSIYKTEFEIPELKEQIFEMKNFNLEK